LGDFIKVLYLRQEGYSFGKSLVSVLADRLFDLISLLVIGYAGMFLFLSLFENQIIVLSLFFILTISMIFLILNKEFNKKILKKIYISFIPEKYKKNLKINFNDFFNDLFLLKPKRLVLPSILTLFGWVIYYVIMYLLAMSIELDISFVYLVVCVSIVGVVTLIPVSISGIGTRDATLIVLFSYIGLSSESAVAFSTLILFIYLVSGVIGFVAWIKKPIALHIE